MDKWKPEVYRHDRAKRVKTEYQKLLSVKVCPEEAERRSFEYATEGADRNSWDAGRVWLALALREWELGRLSEKAKAQALKWIHMPGATVSMEALRQLEITLLSPAPSPKRIAPPRGIRKCPYPVGSLLAYRMISSPQLSGTPFQGKYVLLRVIKINRTPVTPLAPDACWNESMLVGLYDWIGDAIPDPGIVHQLRFTPIVLHEPEKQAPDRNRILHHLPEELSGELRDAAEHFMTRAEAETCCCLDWICAKGIDSNEVFTFMGCDDRFATHLSPFFDTAITAYSFAHSIPFDVMLKNRFEQSRQS